MFSSTCIPGMSVVTNERGTVFHCCSPTGRETMIPVLDIYTSQVICILLWSFVYSVSSKSYLTKCYHRTLWRLSGDMFSEDFLTFFSFAKKSHLYLLPSKMSKQCISVDQNSVFSGHKSFQFVIVSCDCQFLAEGAFVCERNGGPLRRPSVMIGGLEKRVLRLTCLSTRIHLPIYLTHCYLIRDDC